MTAAFPVSLEAAIAEAQELVARLAAILSVGIDGPTAAEGVVADPADLPDLPLGGAS